MNIAICRLMGLALGPQLPPLDIECVLIIFRPRGVLQVSSPVHCSANCWMYLHARSVLGHMKVQNGKYELGRVQGQALGCGAHLTALRRESIGAHSVAGAWELADLVEAAQKARNT